MRRLDRSRRTRTPQPPRSTAALMECLIVIACSAGAVFARLAMMQDLNPLVWGTLAVVFYAGAPVFMIYRGAGWMDAHWVWLSSFGGLFVLFIVQSIAAANRRRRNR